MARAGVLDLSRPEVPALAALRVAADLDPARREQTALVFTGPVAGEGTTTLASSYALSVAAAGRRVLLIDGDLHTAGLTDRFGWPRTPGLTDVLTGDADRGSVVRPYEHQGAVVDVVPAGSPLSGAADVLRSEALADLVDVWTQTYDLVVIDAPPVLTYPDARALSTLRMDTVVVVQKNQQRKRVTNTLTELQRAGGNVIGLVVNNA
jgi:capsular exopolysaccharide synthesis family protein